MRLRPLPRPSGDTLRRVIFEITTITIGILIALWVDEAREARRDASLVRSAHQALAREISGNHGDTASRTGALALMDYAAIAEYAELYDLQDLVDQTQQRYVQILTEQSIQLFLATRNSAGVSVRPPDLEAAREQAMSLLGAPSRRTTA